MNYLKHYDNLCSTRKKLNRNKLDNNYYEIHHIVPRWMNGSDDDSNLVLLTAREHFLAHYLLFKHYKDKQSSAAFHIMCNSTNNTFRDSKKYEEVRIFQSNLLKGDNNPSKRKEVREKISLKTKGELNGMYGRKGSLNPFYKKEHTKEFLEYKKKLHGHRIIYNSIVYDSIREAERLTGVSRYIIKKNCIYDSNK